MLFSQVFLLVTIAICSYYSKRTAYINLIVAVILNTLLIFCFPIIQGEGRRLLLMFSVLFFNGLQGIVVLLHQLMNRRKGN